jgi:hypothetical protein
MRYTKTLLQMRLEAERGNRRPPNRWARPIRPAGSCKGARTKPTPRSTPLPPGSCTSKLAGFR